jgi:hypothetical protein
VVRQQRPEAVAFYTSVFPNAKVETVNDFMATPAGRRKSFPTNCTSSKEFQKESYPLRGQKNVVTIRAEINGVRGLFILDTGASYVSMKTAFAE